MSWHEVIDQRSYEMHQVIAEILREDPSKLNAALEWIDELLSNPGYSSRSKVALEEWRDLIRSQGLEGVLIVLSDRGEQADHMRHSSPFARLMPQDKRLEIFRRYEARRPRACSPGI
jgi:hypothetical protein